MAIERILQEIRNLPKPEQKQLLLELERNIEKNEPGDGFEKAAGAWVDFDADSFVTEVYSRRTGSKRTISEW